MKGLMTKDFLTVKKKYGLTRLIMDFAIITALMIILEGAGAIYISFLLVPLEVASMLITLANSDEQWKWGKYAVALPVSKKQIVSSRYAFAGIAAIIGLCVSLIVNTISYFCFPTYRFGFYLFIAVASFCVVLLFLAFILPSNYWMGVNAGFAVMFIMIILLVVLGIWSKMTNNAIIGFIVDNFDLSMVIGFVSTIAIFALSYILSITLFQKKYA
jgi:ABC-2 type transport system permease protein